ncbi:ComF family protein [Candidatus Nomurabacteria bacterium]|nr:ComF family protein [Candidatus Nomurabacteria bacterium]
MSLFAPHSCLACGLEPDLLCATCRQDMSTVPPACIVCGSLESGSLTCSSCKRVQKCDAVYVSYPYNKLAQQIVHTAKFNRAVAAHRLLAELLDETLPAHMPDFVVTNVPTVYRHVRQRGFDHTERIAKHLAEMRKLPFQRLLERKSNLVQVGSARQDRLEQMKGAFRFAVKTTPSKVLIIDDVKTTGASLSECARELKRAGVEHVYAAVFAKA